MLSLPNRKPNYTPFARHYHTARPISQAFVANPPAGRRPPGVPMARLSFGAMTAKEDMPIPRLFRLIEEGPLDSKFIFPDTGFITNAMHPRFWRLGAGRNIAFAEMTAHELTGWCATPFHNPYLHAWLPRALRQCLSKPAGPDSGYRTTQVLGAVEHDLVPFSVGVANKGWFRRFGFDHYVDVLSVRKRLGLAAFKDLQGTLGRLPDDKEFKRHLSDRYHPRLGPIAYKGWKDAGKRNWLADEELVVTAALTAIVTGRETLILTWDTDVFDQFAQLMHALSMDYTAFRYAEVHYQNPEGCPMYPLPIPPDFGGMAGFKGSEVRNIILPEREMERLWPQAYTPVHAYCVLLGNNCLDPKVSVAAYCLEAEMGMMLEEKGTTAGKNTSRFPGRNMIVGTSLAEERRGTLFVLGEQVHLEYEGVSVSWHDKHAALKADPLVMRKHCLG